MTREEMIEEARKAIHAVIPGSGAYDSWDAAKSQGLDFLGDIAEAAFAVFEKAQAPTDGCECKRSAKKVSMSGGHVNKTADSLHVPTDDERETLPVASRDVWGWDTCVVCGSKEVSDRGMVVMGASNGTPYVARIAWCDQSQECREDLRQTSFLLTEPDVKVIDGFRRPAQTEPTDAQVKAAIQGRYAAFRRNVNATETHLMRAALIAAFTAGQEEQS